MNLIKLSLKKKSEKTKQPIPINEKNSLVKFDFRNLLSLNLNSNAKILELGFGGGQTAEMILENGYYYDGLF